MSFCLFFSFSEAGNQTVRKFKNLFFHSYVRLQENNYQLHSKNSAPKTIAKEENK